MTHISPTIQLLFMYSDRCPTARPPPTPRKRQTDGSLISTASVAFPLTFATKVVLEYRDADIGPLSMDLLVFLMQFHEEAEYADHRAAMTMQVSNLIRQRVPSSRLIGWYLRRAPEHMFGTHNKVQFT